MRKNNFIFFVFFLFLILSSWGAVAQPPFQASESGTLSVITPKQEIYKKDVPMDFNVMVFNSNGSLRNGSFVNCFLDINNQTDIHIFEEQMLNDSNGKDLHANLNSSIMQMGTYTFVVWCEGVNGESENGFLSSSYSVTIDGEKKTDDSFLAGILIILPLLFGFMLVWWALSLSEEHDVFRIFLSLFASFMFVVGLQFATVAIIRFYGSEALQDLVGTTAYWAVWIFIVMIIYWLIYIFVKAVHLAAQKRRERLEY